MKFSNFLVYAYEIILKPLALHELGSL